MKVLLSWSRKRSRATSELLQVWLPVFLPGIEPWMSDSDICKGRAWWDEVRSSLAQAKGCIISMTDENVRSAWLYFEAGRIAGNGDNVPICPYLVGVGPSLLAGTPLAQYQCTESTKKDTLRLVKSLNAALDEAKRHHEEVLTGNFESRWPKFERHLRHICPSSPSVR